MAKKQRKTKPYIKPENNTRSLKFWQPPKTVYDPSEYLESLNEYKDLNRWNRVIPCVHVNEDDEYGITFSGTEFILCAQCIQRLSNFVAFIT